MTFTARKLGVAAMIIGGSVSGCASIEARRAWETSPMNPEQKARLAKEDERRIEAQRQQRIADAEQERKQSEWKAKPHIAVARALPIFEGAVVCPTFDRVQLAYRLQVRWWEDAMQDKLTRGQSRMLRDPMPKPDMAALGCVMVPAGEEMTVRMGGYVPEVTITRNGVSFQGTTLAAMLVIQDKI